MASAIGGAGAVHVSAAEGFTAKTIAAYEKGRPEWDQSQMQFILDTCGISGSGLTHPVVEIGAGTGKSTRPLLAALESRCKEAGLPLNFIVVEPTSMGDELPLLAAEHPGMQVLKTTADKLATIESNSVGLVIVAQAFHWFANVESLTEMHRILRPGGYFVVCWNMRERSEDKLGRIETFLDDYYDPATPRQHTKEWLKVLEAFPGFEDLQHRTLDRPGHVTTAEDLVLWIMSISVIAKRSEDEKRYIAEQLRVILADESIPRDVADDGTALFTVPMYTDYYWCKKRA